MSKSVSHLPQVRVVRKTGGAFGPELQGQSGEGRKKKKSNLRARVTKVAKTIEESKSVKEKKTSRVRSRSLKQNKKL